MGSVCHKKNDKKQPIISNNLSIPDHNPNINAVLVTSPPKNDLLYIITTFFNPAQYSRRLKLHKEFLSRLSDNPLIRVITVEYSLNNQPFQVTSPDQLPYQIQIRGTSILWVKESLMNIALKYLLLDSKFNTDCKYVAWVDNDIEFSDPFFLSKLKESLEKFTIVQMFRQAYFLDANENLLETFISFGYYWTAKKMVLLPGEYGHPGYAWATTKEKILQMGEFYDMGILGNGDKHMAAAFINHYEEGFIKSYTMSSGYIESLRLWQEKIKGVFEGKLGFVDMEIRHHWHGTKDDRQYMWRWKLLMDYKFDPLKDLFKKNGLFYLMEEKKELRMKIWEFFHQRNEDKAINEEFIEEKIPEEYNKWKGNNKYFEIASLKIEKHALKKDSNNVILKKSNTSYLEDSKIKPIIQKKQIIKDKKSKNYSILKGDPKKHHNYLMFYPTSENHAEILKKHGFANFKSGIRLFSNLDLARTQAVKNENSPVLIKVLIKFEDTKIECVGKDEYIIQKDDKIQFKKIIYLYENNKKKENVNNSCY